MRRISTQILISVLSLHALADVNIKNASFEKDAAEIKTKNSEIKRHYSSHSLNNGVFGFGWCSDLDKSIDISNPQILKYSDCAEREDKFLELSEERGPKRIYRAKGAEIILDHGIYKYLDQGVVRALFNKEGKLIENKKPDIQLSYDQGHINEIKLSHKAYKVVQDPRSLKINQMKGPETISYTYRDQNLVLVKTNEQITARIQYGEFHDIIKFENSETGTEEIKYEKNQVSTYRDNNCLTTFEYKTLVEYNVSHMQKICDGQMKVDSTYSFYYQTDFSGAKVLTKVQIKRGSKNTEINYHPELKKFTALSF